MLKVLVVVLVNVNLVLLLNIFLKNVLNVMVRIMNRIVSLLQITSYLCHGTFVDMILLLSVEFSYII